jgi:hypothetical protein
MSNEQMDLLLEDRLAPITSSMGFIEGECSYVAKRFVKWRKKIGRFDFYTKHIKVKNVTGNLEEIFRALLPLKMVQSNRYLFIPTTGKWTAYFDNGYRGTDPTAISYLPELLQSRSVWVVTTLHTRQPSTSPRRSKQGALILQVYGHEEREWLNLIRKIRLEIDVGKWEFQQSGEPFEFEEIERYQAKRIRDRFDFDMLERYLKALELSPFEEDFYLPSYDRSAVFVEISTKHPERNKDVTLEEARRLNGYD